MHGTAKLPQVVAEAGDSVGAAARSVLAGVATAMPKAADGAAEMVRQIKIARDTAVKARTTAMTTLKTLLVNAPSRVREALEPLTDQRLIDRCATSDQETSSTRLPR